MGSVPAFNLTFPATASTILSLLLPEDTVDYLGIFVLATCSSSTRGKKILVFVFSKGKKIKSVDLSRKSRIFFLCNKN